MVTNTDKRCNLHSLVDQLPFAQLAAVENLLKTMLNPHSCNPAMAPLDDEPYTEEDRLAVAEADEWRRHNDPLPLENVLADFGLSMTDWDRMGRPPLPDEQKGHS